MADSLSDDLRRHLYMAFQDGPRRDSCWVMNAEWFNEIRRMESSCGTVLWEPPSVNAADLLFGIPILVREGGGVPHLERVEWARAGRGRDGELDHFRIIRHGRL